MGSCVSQKKTIFKNNCQTSKNTVTDLESKPISDEKSSHPQYQGTLIFDNSIQQQSNKGSNQAMFQESFRNTTNDIFQSCDGQLFQKNLAACNTQTIQVSQSIQELSKYSEKSKNKKVQEYNQLRMSRKNNVNKYTIENLRTLF